ncbi:MAG: UDP-N-acetylglucosamine 2-epimerase (hydrolyzing) [Bacteriovoracaceae bacterium]|nr:UDP-N-acetylglucosamine 2-epimerase (hydrolyzing) [Bacteriovoracaceae bacterium]
MKKVVAFTSTRADYGPIFHLIKSLSSDCELHLFVTGTHLSMKHGYTIDLIDKSIFKNIHKLPVDLEGTEADIFASTLKLVSAELKKQHYDIAIVLGDRFEALAFGVGAFMENIPLVHLHGGEITYGAKDDSYRHCLTKLSQLHFTAHQDYSKRVIQLGENPTSVFNVGAFGLEYLKSFNKKSKAELSKILDFDLTKKIFLVTLHSETHDESNVENAVREVLDGLAHFTDASIVITMPNIDVGGKIIRKYLNEFCRTYKNAKCFENLGSDNYLSVMAISNIVIGNSSSGIYEAPYFKIPTINIGSRQAGRIKAESVIDVKYDKDQIRDTIQRVLKGLDLKDMLYPFGQPDAYIKAKDIILNFSFEPMKKFYDKN